LVSLFLAILISDSNIAFTASAIFWWLLVFSSKDVDRFFLIFSHLAFLIDLRGPLKVPSHLFDQFLTFCILFQCCFNLVLV
jgi:hypothetical protein